MKAPEKARSPYQRYNKRPHQYSTELRAWRMNPTAANDSAWCQMMRRRGHRPDDFAGCVMPRVPRRQSFPEGVRTFNPFPKPGKPRLMAAE